MPKGIFNMNYVTIQSFLNLNLPGHKMKIKFLLIFFKEKCIAHS